jgi:elongator complex protein 3
VDPEALRWQSTTYPTDATTEWFLSAITETGRLAGFLRLSLPKRGSRASLAQADHRQGVFDEIRNYAMIREVHVYGPALALGTDSEGDAQHAGIGQRLIEMALSIARSVGYRRIAVIAATGTRDYYRRWGFSLGRFYMLRDI